MTKCEMVWTPERAKAVSEAVEKASGELCPCKVGKPCPFVKLDDVTRAAVAEDQPGYVDA